MSEIYIADIDVFRTIDDRLFLRTYRHGFGNSGFYLEGMSAEKLGDSETNVRIRNTIVSVEKLPIEIKVKILTIVEGMSESNRNKMYKITSKINLTIEYSKVGSIFKIDGKHLNISKCDYILEERHLLVLGFSNEIKIFINDELKKDILDTFYCDCDIGIKI